MAGDHTVNGLLNQREEVDRADLPFTNKPSSGIYGDRTVNTYGTLPSSKIEKGRTIESGTQEGAGALAPGTKQTTSIERPTVGTLPAWNSGVGANATGMGPTQLSKPAGEENDGDTSDTNTDATGGSGSSGSVSSDEERAAFTSSSSDDSGSDSGSGESTARKATSSTSRKGKSKS